VDIDVISALEIVDSVKRIQEPYKTPTASSIGLQCHRFRRLLSAAAIFQLIAGPCSVETEDQICTVAREVKEAGATMLRGGAFKPRTSPTRSRGLERMASPAAYGQRETAFPS
jgi:3-deoxy-7-phosphoheptulonate synthase